MKSKDIIGLDGYKLSPNGEIISPLGSVLTESGTGQVRVKVKNKWCTISANKIRFSVDYGLNVFDIPSNTYFVNKDGHIVPKKITEMLSYINKLPRRKHVGVTKENLSLHQEWINLLYDFVMEKSDGSKIAVFLESHRYDFIHIVSTKYNVSFKRAAEAVDESLLRVLERCVNGQYFTNILYEVCCDCCSINKKNKLKVNFKDGYKY